MGRKCRNIAAEEVPAHPAATAWSRLGYGPERPAGIEVLKETGRSGVYRLLLPQHSLPGIIAKRCSRERASVERLVYEQVLSALPLPSARLFGWLDNPDSSAEPSAWLFLEDVGTRRYCSFNPGERTAAARWLGRFHGLCGGSALRRSLPDRGPRNYFPLLLEGLDKLAQFFGTARMPAADRYFVEFLMHACDLLRDSWIRIEEICAEVPRTLVHGDCLAKSIRVRRGDEIVPIDWGTCGWGLLGVDLGLSVLPSVDDRPGEADVPAYMQAVGAPGRCTPGQLRAVFNLGHVFWVSSTLGKSYFDPEYPEGILANLRVYAPVLANALTQCARDGLLPRFKGEVAV